MGVIMGAPKIMAKIAVSHPAGATQCTDQDENQHIREYLRYSLVSCQVYLISKNVGAYEPKKLKIWSDSRFIAFRSGDMMLRSAKFHLDGCKSRIIRATQNLLIWGI